MRAVAILFGLASILALPACGTAGDDSGRGLDRATFIARSDALCSDARARSGGPIEAPPSTGVLRAALDTNVTDGQRVRLRVRSSRPPYDPRLERFLDESARVGDALRQYLTVTGRIEREASGRAIEKAQRASERAAVAARAYGFRVCGQGPA